MPVRWGLCLIFLSSCIASAPRSPSRQRPAPAPAPLPAVAVATTTVAAPAIALADTASTSTIAALELEDEAEDAGGDLDDMAEMDESRTITSTVNALRYSI